MRKYGGLIAQIKIGVVGKIANGILVASRLIIQTQFVVVGPANRQGKGKVARESACTVGRKMGQHQTVVFNFCVPNLGGERRGRTAVKTVFIIVLF